VVQREVFFKGRETLFKGFFPSKKFTLVEHYKTWGISVYTSVIQTLEFDGVRREIRR